MNKEITRFLKLTFGKIAFGVGVDEHEYEHWGSHLIFEWKFPLQRSGEMIFFPPIRMQHTLWCQLEDMFQLIGTSQGIERVLFQIIVTPEYFEKYRVKYKAWHKFW